MPLRDKSESPGPGNYSMNTGTSPMFKKSPIPIIGKANRKTWIEVASRNNDSPGPGLLYPSKRLVLRATPLYS